MKMALFDLSGTVFQYGTARPMPLMPEVLTALRDKGWKIAIVSRHSKDHCASLLTKAGIDYPVSVFSSGSSPKGQTVAGVLNETRCDESIYVDDKPDNLASVLHVCGGSITRLIGFVGSRKYTPHLSHWCRENQVELALSPPDLCEGLPVHVDSMALLHSAQKWSDEEVAALIPGLDHPMSAITGETGNFDHRTVLTELLENRHPRDYRLIWRNIAWITCNDCLWKALVRTVLQSLSLDVAQVLGAADKQQEYTDALRKLRSNKREDLRLAFEHAVSEMVESIQEIGVDAETCRVNDRPMSRDRLKIARQRIHDALT
jgi:hypothetical protein